MKKLIAISFTALTLGTIFSLPARADSSEVARFCAEYGDLTNSDDIATMLQNFIGEIEDMTMEDWDALNEVRTRISDGEELSDICDD